LVDAGDGSDPEGVAGGNVVVGAAVVVGATDVGVVWGTDVVEVTGGASLLLVVK
jgi:hypothetical protein